MHEILSRGGLAIDRTKATSRSVAAAARVHPAGVAVPSAGVVTAIVIFTFVMAAVIPALPPSLFGAGSPPAIQAGTSQSRHRVQPQQPVLTGPPILPSLPGILGQNAPSLTGGGRPASTLAAAPPPGFVAAPGANQAPSSCLTCDVSQAPRPAVTDTSTMVQGVTRVLTSGSAVTSATTPLATAAHITTQAADTATSTLPTATVTTTAKATVTAATTTVTAATTTVAGVSTAVQGIARVQGSSGQDGQDSVEGSVSRALPASGTVLPGVGQ
jgi:hypothetical protein